jgi:hypothetical protein
MPNGIVLRFSAGSMLKHGDVKIRDFMIRIDNCFMDMAFLI